MTSRTTPLAALLLLAATTLPAIEISLEAGYQDFTLSRSSAKAVFGGAPGGPIAGIALTLPLGDRFFLRPTARFLQRTGERVFVEAPRAEVFRLGHPLRVRMVPLHALVGARFRRDRAISPYVEAGPGATLYAERSDIAGLVESTSTTRLSGHAAIGFETGRGGVRIGAELGFTTVPGALGKGGVSRVYGESDAGGISAVVRLCFGGRR